MAGDRTPETRCPKATNSSHAVDHRLQGICHHHARYPRLSNSSGPQARALVRPTSRREQLDDEVVPSLTGDLERRPALVVP